MGWLRDFLSSFFSGRRQAIQIWESPPVSLGDILPSQPSTFRSGIVRTPGSEQLVKSRGLSYFISKGTGKDWVDLQYNHVEIETIFDVESFFARATRAKLALFCREGFSFVGPKDDRVEYIRTRIRQIERASKLPFPILLEQTARDLLVHSNAYWLKIRKLSASGGRIRKIGERQVQPVAGYFSLPPETMVPEVDSSGNIIRWKQTIDGEEKIFSSNDIVHFYTNKKVGYPLGVPSIVPCIDDIRAIRSIEANIDVLIHKHLFPIIVWKVGTDDVPPQTFETGTSELELVQDVVAAMPTEGSIVVPNRLEVDAIGAENKALRVESYLQHFKERILAGLDVSSVDVGQGSASSRSTAMTLSRNLIDIVKKNQCTIEAIIQQVIDELLLESTFSEDSVLSSENSVSLRFKEIDKEAKFARENHAVDMFLKNAITYPEMREELGREPLTPEEEKELYWPKFGREESLIKAVDENSGKGVAVTPSSGAITNKNKPANQHGSRPSAKINKDFKDLIWVPSETINPILAWHQAIQEELQARWAANKDDFNLELAAQDIRLSYNTAYQDFVVLLHRVIRENYHDPLTIFGLYEITRRQAETYITRLRKNLISRLRLEIDRGNSPNIAFDALRYRTSLIYKTELSRAGNLARFKWIAKSGADAQVVSNGTPCDLCAPQLTLISRNDRLAEERLPPFHPHCECLVVVAKKDN